MNKKTCMFEQIPSEVIDVIMGHLDDNTLLNVMGIPELLNVVSSEQLFHRFSVKNTYCLSLSTLRSMKPRAFAVVSKRLQTFLEQPVEQDIIKIQQLLMCRETVDVDLLRTILRRHDWSLILTWDFIARNVTSKSHMIASEILKRYPHTVIPERFMPKLFLETDFTLDDFNVRDSKKKYLFYRIKQELCSSCSIEKFEKCVEFGVIVPTDYFNIVALSCNNMAINADTLFFIVKQIPSVHQTSYNAIYLTWKILCFFGPSQIKCMKNPGIMDWPISNQCRAHIMAMALFKTNHMCILKWIRKDSIQIMRLLLAMCKNPQLNWKGCDNDYLLRQHFKHSDQPSCETIQVLDTPWWNHTKHFKCSSNEEVCKNKLKAAHGFAREGVDIPDWVIDMDPEGFLCILGPQKVALDRCFLPSVIEKVMNWMPNEPALSSPQHIINLFKNQNCVIFKNVWACAITSNHRKNRQWALRVLKSKERQICTGDWFPTPLEISALISEDPSNTIPLLTNFPLFDENKQLVLTVVLEEQAYVSFEYMLCNMIVVPEAPEILFQTCVYHDFSSACALIYKLYPQTTINWIRANWSTIHGFNNHQISSAITYVWINLFHKAGLIDFKDHPDYKDVVCSVMHIISPWGGQLSLNLLRLTQIELEIPEINFIIQNTACDTMRQFFDEWANTRERKKMLKYCLQSSRSASHKSWAFWIQTD